MNPLDNQCLIFVDREDRIHDFDIKTQFPWFYDMTFLFLCRNSPFSNHDLMHWPVSLDETFPPQNLDVICSYTFFSSRNWNAFCFNPPKSKRCGKKKISLVRLSLNAKSQEKMKYAMKTTGISRDNLVTGSKQGGCRVAGIWQLSKWRFSVNRYTQSFTSMFHMARRYEN